MRRKICFSLGAAMVAGLISSGLTRASIIGQPQVEIAVNGGSFVSLTNQSGTSGQFQNSGGSAGPGLSWQTISASATNGSEANLQLTISNLTESSSTGPATFEIQVTDTGFTFTGATTNYLETSGVLDTTSTTGNDLVSMESGADGGNSPYTYTASVSPSNSPISASNSTNTQSYTFDATQTNVSLTSPYSLSTEFIGNMGAGDIFGTLGGSTIVTTTPVPEPATLALLAAGGLGILIRRRKSA